VPSHLFNNLHEASTTYGGKAVSSRWAHAFPRTTLLSPVTPIVSAIASSTPQRAFQETIGCSLRQPPFRVNCVYRSVCTIARLTSNLLLNPVFAASQRQLSLIREYTAPVRIVPSIPRSSTDRLCLDRVSQGRRIGGCSRGGLFPVNVPAPLPAGNNSSR